jgi:hypothetical protein
MKDLLVTITDKNASFGRPELTSACRGHNNKGVVLNYFIFEASREAKKKGINKDEVEYVEIERTQEQIIEGVHGATQSKKTINLYTKQFQEWGFVDADSYHHKYKVYFKNIQAAVDSPPPIDSPKPRGAHAKKDGEGTNDTNGKNAISPDSKNTICNHEDEMVKMRFQMVNLASEMVKMSFEIAKLRNGQSCEDASGDASSHIFDPLESIRLLESIKENIYVSNDTSHTQNPPTFSSQLGENDETPEGNADTSMASVHDTAPAHSDNPVSDNTNIDTDVQKEIKDTPFHIDGLTTRKHVSKGKKRKSKAEPSLTDTTPIPPPEKPSEDEPWTPLTCMKLADYYRGSVLAKNNRKGSDYQKAVEAAIALVNQQHKTYQEVDVVFRFMLCLDKGKEGEVYDDWWEGKVVDLWHLEKHCTGKLREMQIKKMELSQELNDNVTPFRQPAGAYTNKTKVLSSYDDPNYVDDTFYGQNLTLEKALVARGAN